MSRKIYGTIYVVSFLIFPWLVLSPSISLLTNIQIRLGIFCLLVVVGAILFRQVWSHQGWGVALTFTTLGYASAYKLASFIPDISTYPFSLGWSEASRYYYASLWLSKQIYGLSVPPSVLHPSRYLMQSIPFLIPNSSLWLNRFWQVFLWVSTASLTSWMLVRKLASPGNKKPLVITLSMTFWGFIFLFQGPIYYHLLFMVILVLWGYDGNRFWRTMLVVLVASLWAGISRVNWLPVPGMLAGALYLMEVEVGGKFLWRYLLRPAIWVVAGTGIAYASQLAYQGWSGNPPAWFGSSFTSDLLWYRLLPNATFPMGILPSAILVSLPLIGLIYLRLIKNWRKFHIIRLLGLAAILGVLFVGGVIVSVKIGGGSNLHNLDAYLTLLLVISSYFFFDRVKSDYVYKPVETSPEMPNSASSKLYKISEGIFIAGAIVIPLYFSLTAGGQLPMRDFATAQVALQTLNTEVQDTVNHGGKVLFINQRQLLTFNYIRKVPLVPDYELVFLMEMAMAGNSAYMDAFHADISKQRFAMIVAENLVIHYQDRTYSFGEENNAWVDRVSEPVLCYYEPAIKLDSVGLVIYTPRTNPCR